MKTSDYELERLTLGSFILLSDLSTEIGQKCLGIIKANMFTDKNHQVIYENIRKISKSGRAVEFIELSESVANDNSYTQPFTYVGEIYRNTSSAINLLSYCQELRGRAQKRFAIGKLNESLILLNSSDEAEVNNIMGGLGSFVDEFINKRSNDKGIKHISEIMPKFLEAVDNRFDDPERFAGYTSGFEQLDNIMGVKKLRKGSLFVVGARPKMGKSMFKSKMVNHFALRLNKAVLDFSMEMLGDEVVERAIADDVGISTDIFYRGSNNQSDWGLVGDSTARLNSSNLYINDQTGLTLGEIKSQARTIHKKHEVGLIAIDYLTLMKGEKAERNDLAYGEITKGLKSLAKELECVVLLLTQLNRGLESRSDKRPLPSDSRDTGQIEQDCDYWVGIYRESVYSDQVPDSMRGFTEIELRLNRHGGTGRAYLNMNKGRFEEITLHDYARMDHLTNINKATTNDL